jgi:hypothetical protein
MSHAGRGLLARFSSLRSKSADPDQLDGELDDEYFYFVGHKIKTLNPRMFCPLA